MKKALIITDPFEPDLSLEIKQMFYNQNVKIDQLCIKDMFNSVFFKNNYLLDIGEKSLFNFREIAKVLASFIINERYNYVCCASTQYAKNLIARISVNTDSGLVADVLSFEIKEENIELNRPIYSNKMLATICCKSPISMFSVIEGVYPQNQKRELGKVEVLTYELSTLKYKVIDKTSEYKLTDGQFIFTLGMGAKDSIKNFLELEKLINIKIGATKKLVDANLLSYEHQIGISGKVVAPKIYIGLGVEGFIHHILGMNKSELIISINSNPKAAINKLADIVIIGDANLFSIQLINKLNKEIQSQ